MAIQFARIKIVSRKDGGNACHKGAYNGRSEITDDKTNITYNFISKGDNVYHDVLLPDFVDSKYKDISVLMNAVEYAEKRKNSQLLKDIVIALPDDKEFSLEDRINITHEIIGEMEWVKNGLAVQVDIHEPHDGEKNWHAHLLVTTRRFSEDGKNLGEKARDLNPEFKSGKNGNFIIPEEDIIHEKGKRIINNYAKRMGYETRVDVISLNPQEHVGPMRMRSVMNAAAERNEERRVAEIEHLNSGTRVLKKVTKNMSVFTKGDLTRAVKCIPNSDARARLVEGALSNKSVIALYREEGDKTQYFTTKKVRSEENKIVRLSQYVANENNVFAMSNRDNLKQTKELINNAQGHLTEEQHRALSELILSNSGLRILRGKAGSGKSYVLKELATIASSSSINVIGLAPTHKAKIALASDGFKNTDTIKGMLFKLLNGRFNLPKNSLIVVDEAGMVGNDDIRELLRVAATRKCNVILAGDEKQLASVGRGGMFEVFAERYGSSTILDIQRQDSNWGKAVAMALSNGHVQTGISVLEKEGRIKWSDGSSNSMQLLLSDWIKSDYEISDRVILAVKNKDVAALNHGVREHLKLKDRLVGDEIAVGGNHYMKGDRILITKTNKDLGVINGDIAEIIDISLKKFTIRFASGNKENNKEISFNPSKYHGFRHGYATTIFKAQGASIKDVYVFHNGFAGIRNSYVALSRNINELNLYSNKEATTSTAMLIKQLSHDIEAGSSLAYLTKEELEFRALDQRLANDSSRFIRGVNSIIDFASNTATKIADKYLPSSEYYNYKEPKKRTESAEYVIDRTYEEIEQKNQIIMEEKLVVGGHASSSSKSRVTSAADNRNINVITPIDITNSESSNVNNDKNNNRNKEIIGSATTAVGVGKVRQSAKSRFYAKADKIRSQQQYQAQKEEWGLEYERLKSEIRFKAERITRDLLGDPNKHLSNGREMRYGDHGKLAVRISGEKAGTWYDFSKGEGGDLFALVQETKGGSFKDAAEYLRGSVGMSKSSNVRANLQLVHDHANSDLTAERIKNNKAEKRLSEQKQAYSIKLHERSKDIGKKSVAHRYLTNQRFINCRLSDDIKTAGIYSKTSSGYLPALIVFARDKDGNITGGQHILLDKKTAGKADIDVPKKSFGKIAGSFVNLGNTQDGVNDIAKSDITIISEGVETGLSVKQALIGHNEKGASAKLLCSLGIGNIKNYEPYKGEKIIIAADNDKGHNKSHGDENIPITAKTIATAKYELESKGAFVEIVKPDKEGDFNDVLKYEGAIAIVEKFKPAIARHMAKTLGEYISSNKSLDCHLTKDDKANLDYVEKYNLSQERILNAWRINPDKGREEFAVLYSKILSAERSVEANKPMLDLAKTYNIEIDKSKLVSASVEQELKPANESIEASGEKECIHHILAGFNQQKTNSKKIGQILNIIKKEDDFLSEVNLKHKQDLDRNLQDRITLSKTGESKNIIASIKQNLEANHKQGIVIYGDLSKILLSSKYDIKTIANGLQEIAIKGRKDHCRVVSVELAALEKLFPQYDKDHLVSILKTKSREDKEQYINAVLAEHTKKHIEPLFEKYADEKAKATNFTEFLSVIEKEQKTYVDLNNKHPLAIYAVDKQNGNIKLSFLMSSANDLHKKTDMQTVMAQIRYAIKNDITTEDQVTKNLKKSEGNLKSLYTSLDKKCQVHSEKLATYSRDKDHGIQKEPEQNKQKEVKIDKGFSM